MKMRRYLFLLLSVLLCCGIASAQSVREERSNVRKGHRSFKKENYSEAEIGYKKALVADSTSVSADYNLGNTYYRMENYTEADRYFKAGLDSLSKGSHGADAWHNQGNSLLKQRNWQGAVEAYKNALRRNPGDMETKSNLAYAQKMLENEQQNGGGNDNQDQNQDQNQDKNNDPDQNDQNQNQDQQQDQNQDQQQRQGQQPRITPQAAQQMLQAIQAQEDKTQDKVKKEKAAKLKSKQKEKNW